MKILVDGSIYSFAPGGGIYRYLNEILPRLGKYADTNIELLTSGGGDAIPELQKVAVRKDPLKFGFLFPEGVFKQKLREIKKRIREEATRLRTRNSTDLLFHSIYYTPPPTPEMPTIATVYDMISEIFPKMYSDPALAPLKAIRTKSVSNARRLIAISECTRQDVHRMLGVSLDKIDVVHMGVDANEFSTPISENEMKGIPNWDVIRNPYLLFVGGRLLHKNFIGFIKAYAGSAIHKEIPLVVAGGTWSEDETQWIKRLGLQNRITLIENPDNRTLAGLYQRAKAFVFPSLYEGFGIPLIEAMAAGCPVVASRTGPFPELGGEAALYFDPENSADMSKKMEEILNPATAAKYQALGRERAKLFSWDRTAERTHAAYLRAIKNI